MQQQHENQQHDVTESHTRPIDDSAFLDYELLCHMIENRRRRDDQPDSPGIPLLIERLKRVSGWSNFVLTLLYAGARVVDEDAREMDFGKEFHGWMLDFLLRMYVEGSGEDVANADGFSVLHIACTRSKVEFARGLLEGKADLNRQIAHRSNSKFVGYTPLHFAVYHGNHEVAELLLKRGARIYEHDLNGSTPLHVACYRRDSKMIDLILTHDRVTANVIDSNGLSNFMIACTSSKSVFAEEHLRIAECQPWISVKILINSCTKNIVDGQFAGYTPLHFAAEFGNAEVFELLLARGARCCALSDQSFTPLMLAYKHGHERIVRIFECRCERYETRRVDVDENLNVRVVFEKSVSDRKAVENALVCVTSEESGYVSEKESVEMNVVSEKSVVVSVNDSVEKIDFAKALGLCVVTRESETDALQASSRKRTRKTACLACCNPRMTRSKRFRKF